MHYTDKLLSIYEINNDEVNIYDGKNDKVIPKIDFNQMLKKRYSLDHIYIKKEQYYGKCTIREFYNNYLKDATELLEITKGKINLFRDEYLSNISMNFFNNLNLDKLQELNIDEIERFEDEYLSSSGGIRHAVQYEGQGYKYDKISYYHQYLTDSTVSIPIKKGTIQTITNETFYNYHVKYGLYKVEIKPNSTKSFTINKNNIYTHHEVNYAKTLKLDMKLLSNQYLFYDTKDRINADYLFLDFVLFFYDIKKKYNNKLAKIILNSITGKMAQRNIIEYTRSIEDIDECLQDGDIISDLTPTNNGKFKITIYNKNKPKFKYNLARIYIFLIGATRVWMHKTINSVGLDNIVFSHTDSLISKIDISKKLNNKKGKFIKDIGKWKYEGYDPQCKIINMNEYIFKQLKE